MKPWKISLHGGHSGEFCEHAVGTLRGVIEAAVADGFAVYGVSEHAPRSQARFLYDTELERGFTVERLAADFEAYAAEVARLAEEFAGRLTVLRGFEAEVVPSAGYAAEMKALRERHAFDYMVGSVHYVDEIQIDGRPEEFAEAVEAAGGLENLAVRYYETVATMIETLRPEVVGHLDLIRRNAPADAVLDAPRIAGAAERALEAARAVGAALDLNTAGWRKNLGGPYPAPWLLERARDLGVGFCFGDDSHGPALVGDGVERAREYLLAQGVKEIQGLTRRDGAVAATKISLEDGG